jgi:hypothetical protein
MQGPGLVSAVKKGMQEQFKKFKQQFEEGM